MTDSIKVKLVLMIFCMIPVAYALGNDKGFSDGTAYYDQVQFDNYVGFAKPFQKEIRKMKKHHDEKPVNTASRNASVWDAVQ